MWKKMLLFSMIFFVGAALVIYATGPGTGAEAIKGRITLYTSVPQPIVDRLQNEFMKKYPGITLDAFRSDTNAVIAKMMTEHQAGQIMGDLVWVAEPSTYEEFKDQGLLLKIAPPEAANLDPSMKDPEGYYYAARLINMVIAYNTLKVTDPPKSWEDLVTKNYGSMGYPTPLRSGASVAATETLVSRFGWDYFEKFKRNGGMQLQSNATVSDMILKGEHSVGVILDFMVRPLMAKGSPINYVWPAEGTIFIPSPIAVLKNTKNLRAAELFVNYLLSREGQETVVKVGDFYPVRKDVAAPAGAPPIAGIRKLPTDWKAVKDNTKAHNERWTKIFGR
ncbi:MAG: iron(III) transport system substrate-binding protein [Spirochaetes bacterium]|nr:MAG: iron(III) transport system substrate-binding protein [Spirochaetota bacterium]